MVERRRVLGAELRSWLCWVVAGSVPWGVGRCGDFHCGLWVVGLGEAHDSTASDHACTLWPSFVLVKHLRQLL